MHEYLIVFISTAAVYLLLIAALAVVGRKELSQLSIIDLVFLLLLSNAVQNAMVDGKWERLLMGLIAASTLFGLNKLLETSMFKSKSFRKLVEGNPVILVWHGKLIEDHMKKVKLSRDELQEALREHGVVVLKDVKLAVMETDGNISVITSDAQTEGGEPPRENLIS